MYHTAKKEMLITIYRYTRMTSNQLAMVLHYQVPTIYGIVVELKKQGLIRSIVLPFLRKNHVGYILTAYGVKAAASLVGEEEVFRAKAFEEDPVQLEHLYGTNAFFVSLIRQSHLFTGEGLLEWQSTREAAEQYAHFKPFGQKHTPLRPDGIVSYLLSNHWEAGSSCRV
jgi:DNA-binding MarR family transcriptional regulator